MLARNSTALCFVITTLVVSALAAEPRPAVQETAGIARDSVIRIVQQIQRADYEGDRAALNQLYQQLVPFVDEPEIATRVRYWRGFAKWRRGINGLNETPTPKDLAEDLTEGESEFDAAIQRDPGFVDATCGPLGEVSRNEMMMESEFYVRCISPGRKPFGLQRSTPGELHILGKTAR